MLNNKKLILASTSAQRINLLKQLGLEFTTHALSGEEDLSAKLSAADLVKEITMEKARCAFEQLKASIKAPSIVLCADTLVSFEQHRLGKPSNDEEAKEFLSLLSGKTHQVHTGIALFEMVQAAPSSDKTIYSKPIFHYAVSLSQVSFAKLDPDLIDWYLASNEWQGAAGGYKIQGKAAGFIESIEGSYTGIVGLCVNTLMRMLRNLAFKF